MVMRRWLMLAAVALIAIALWPSLAAARSTYCSPSGDLCYGAVRGGAPPVQLRDSVFADIPDQPTGVAGVYPPNARWSYEEFYLGGGATEGKSVVLAASFAANADDPATELADVRDCLPFSIFEEGRGSRPVASRRCAPACT